MQEQEKEDEEILERFYNSESEKRKRIRKTLVVAIISVLIIIIIFLSFSFYTYFKSPEKTLGLGAEIESVLLSADGKMAYVKLLGGSLDKNITKIKFVFSDLNESEYNYETSEGTQEIEVPFKKSFWDWLFGRQLVGSYDYEINSESVGLSDFNNINEISVLFEYQTETGDVINTPVLDTQTQTNRTTTSSEGDDGEDDGTTPTPEPTLTCTNDTGCTVVGNFCSENIPYNCSLNISDGCLDRINKNNCSLEGKACYNGDCVEIIECSNDSYCYSDFWYNLSRLIDEGQCQNKNQTRSEYKDYFCNLSLNICEYQITNQTTWLDFETLNKTNGITCNDSNLCTINDTCNLGVCSGQERSCNDNIICTIDSCSSLTGCNNIANDSLCTSYEYCNPTSGCAERTCSSCADCELFWGINCDYNKCKNDCGECYYDPVLGQENCVILNELCTQRITSCSDYYELECENDICEIGNCSWNGNSCAEVVINVCGDNICGLGENCPTDIIGCVDNTCYEPTCLNGCGETSVSARGNDEGCLLSDEKFCNGNGNCVECIDDDDCGVNETCISGSCIDDSAGCLVYENIFIDSFDNANCIESSSDILIQGSSVSPYGTKDNFTSDNDILVIMPFEDKYLDGSINITTNPVDDLDVLEVYGNVSLVEGKQGQGFYFYGGNVLTYFDKVSIQEIRKRGYSFSAWVNPENLNSYRTIFASGTYSRRQLDFSIRNNKLRWGILSDSGSSMTISGNDTISVNEWHHVAAVYDSYKNEVRLYLDGKLDAKRNFTILFNEVSRPNNLYIGNSAGYDLFQGVIDEVKVFTRPLSDEEVLDIYNENYLDGNFKSREIDLSGSFNTFKTNVNETNPGTTQVFVWQNNNWHRVYSGQESIFDMPGKMPISKLKYKVVFAGNTTLNSLKFEWSNENYSEGDFSFMYLADDNNNRGAGSINFAYNTYPDLKLIFSIPDNSGWVNRKKEASMSYSREWLLNSNSDSRYIPIYMGLGNHDIESVWGVDYAVRRQGPYVPLSLPGMRNYKEGPYDIYSNGYEDRYLTYSFDYKNAHFIMINAYLHDVLLGQNRFNAGYEPTACITNDLLNFLNDSLANTNATFKFLFFHEAAYPAPGSRHAGDSFDYSGCPGNYNSTTGARPMRDKFWNMLSKYNATSTFIGHNHGSSLSWISDPYNQYDNPVYEIESGIPPRLAIVNVREGSATIRLYITPSGTNYTWFEMFDSMIINLSGEENKAPKLYHHQYGIENNYPIISTREYLKNVGQQLTGWSSLYFEAKDPNLHDNLSFSFENLPNFLVVNNQSDRFRRFYFTSRVLTNSDRGTYNFKIKVSDGELEDSMDMKMRVGSDCGISITQCSDYFDAECDSDVCGLGCGWNGSGCIGGVVSVCGDGAIETSEQCDDNNTNNDDGCSSSCLVESGWTCFGEPSVCEEVVGSTEYEGFGAVTRGAEDCPYAGEYEVYHVTKLNDDGSVGTLRNAVSRRCRYIIFDVGGTIALQGDLNMPYSYMTINGSTAPAPGITILQPVGSGTMVEAVSSIGPAHDIIINNLRFDGQSGGIHAIEKDVLGLDGEVAPVYNVILDHITGIESTDGIFDIWRRVYNVTISWNLMMGTVTAMHLATDNFNVNRQDISFHHNVLYHNNERQINLDQGNHTNIDYVNNVIYGWGWMEDGSAGFKFTNLPGTKSSINIEKNIYHYVPGPHNIDGDSEIGHPTENEALQFFNGGRNAFIANGGEVYFNGNIFPAGELDAVSTSGRIIIPAYAEVTKYNVSTLGDNVVPYVGTHYPTQEEQDLLNEVSIAVGGQGLGSSSVFSALLNWIKNILTTKTGNAILTGKTITGNAVNENGSSKVPYIILSILAVIILIIGVVIVRMKGKKKKSKKKIGKSIRRR